MYSRFVLESKVGHEEKRKRKKTRWSGTFSGHWTVWFEVWCIHRGVLVKLGLLDQKVFPIDQHITFKIRWQLLHHPAYPEFSLLEIGWAIARGRSQLAHDNYSGLATLKHWLPCNSNYFSDSGLGLFLILFWVTCAGEKKKRKNLFLSPQNSGD